MRARLRLCRVIKWAALVVLILTVAGWVLTRSSGVTAIVSGWFGVYLGESKVAAYTVRSVVPSQIILGPMASRAHGWSPWTFDWTRTPSRWGMTVPLWSVTLASALAFAGAWWFDTRSRRRQEVGRCARCRYDRRGIAPESACPECGAAASGISKSA